MNSAENNQIKCHAQCDTLTIEYMDICNQDEFCGGCIYQGMPYEEQLKTKDAEVQALIEQRELKIGRREPIEPSPVLYRYRNKMEYTFGDLTKDGEMTLGMHKKGNYMSIITVDHCQLVHEDFNKILRETLRFCIERGYTKYHKRRHNGLMRNLVVRWGVRSGEILVNAVTTGKGTVNRSAACGTNEGAFDEKGFTEMLLALELENEIVGIMHTVNDDFADTVKCDEFHLLHGRDYYMEKVMGLDFKVSEFSFFQTNVIAAERLYKDALDLLDDYENKNVFDLFCGTGTITQTLALKAGHVTGVEIVEEAVEAARENAALNGLDNCTFIAGDVFEVLSGLDDKPDVIVLDPPRAGVSQKALDKIVDYGVEQIVYISCNPKTLMENLAYFNYYGYAIDYLKPYDNFPWTRHVECCCLLSKIYSNER